MEEHSAERLAAIVESSSDAIIGKDLFGTIVSWNKAAQRMFGYPESEAVGKPIYLIIPDDKRDEEADILAAAETWGANRTIPDDAPPPRWADSPDLDHHLRRCYDNQR